MTQQDAYSLPQIDESLNALPRINYFNTLDLVSVYWQMPLDEDAQEKSVFSTRKVMEVEGAALSSNFSPSHFPEDDGADTEWAALEDIAALP